MGEDAQAGGAGPGAIQDAQVHVVAGGEALAGNVGPERVPAGLSAMRPVRGRGIVRTPGGEVMKVAVAALLVFVAIPAFAQAKLSPGAGPSIVVVETEKGTFEFETYPNE